MPIVAGALSDMEDAGLVALSDDEYKRYARQIALEQIGEAGQLKLKSARVLLVGLGGLGSPVALYLAASGVGTLGLCDDDLVDLSNLQRQVIYKTGDVGRKKTTSTAFAIAQCNPHVLCQTFDCRLTEANARELVASFDIVVDCTDSIEARYALSDACAAAGIAMVYGALHKFEGQVSVFCLPDTPCYRCYFGGGDVAAVPTCEAAGVLGVLPGIVGAIQASEVIKLILGLGDVLSGAVLFFDALKMQFKTMQLPLDKQCHCQGAITGPVEPMLPRLSIDASVLKQKLEGSSRPLLIDVRRLDEYRAMRFSNCLHVPLESLADHLSEIKEAIVSAPEVVFYCRSGVRSKTAINLVHQALSAAGLDLTKIPPLYNLSGGILQWYRLHQDSYLESDAKGV